MAIDLLPLLDRTAATFRADVDALFTGGINGAITQMNAGLGAVSAFAAGGAYAFQYMFDSATADADPGVGKLRLGSTTQNASTVLRIDNAMAGGMDLSPVWDDLASVNSVMKASFRIVKATDPTKWMILDVSSLIAATGYRNLAVSVRLASSGSPFLNGDPLMVFVQRAGEKGENGSVGYLRVTDKKVKGTSAGASVAGNNTRALNTIDWNDFGAALSSNNITLPPGTYDVLGSAPALNVGAHQALLWASTGGVRLVEGTSEFAGTSSAATTRSIIAGRFVLSVSSSIQLRHWMASANSVSGLGIANDSPNNAFEVYSELTFRKVA